MSKHLYHYTSQKGLIGILDRSNELWMTNILYLNDSTEFTHTIELVKPELERRKRFLRLFPRDATLDEKLSTNEARYQIYEAIERILDLFKINSRTNSYVFSLSEEKDDLSQWRGYCPDTGGYCIEFDSKALHDIINSKKKRSNEEFKIEKLIYDPDIKNKMINDIFESNYKINDILSRIVNLAPYLKDDSFKNEKEHRIVFSGESDVMQYREGKSMIIPFIKVKFEGNDRKLPISKLIVGPTPHIDLATRSIEYLLETNGYEIEVENSKIPYRSLC